MKTSAFVVTSIISALVTGCSLCGSQIIQSAVSPSGAWTAIVYERDCGATTPVYTVVELLPEGKKRPDGEDRSGLVLSLRNSHEVRVKWVDGVHLVVSCSSCGKVDFSKERQQVRTVSVTYIRAQ